MFSQLFRLATTLNRDDDQLQEWTLHLLSVLSATEHGRNALWRHLTKLPHELIQ